MNVILYLSYDIKITLKSHFCRKNVIICHYVGNVVMDLIRFTENLSKAVNHQWFIIFLQSVISLPDAT